MGFAAVSFIRVLVMKRTALIIALLEAVAATGLYLIGAKAVLVFAAVLFALAVLFFGFGRILKTDRRSVVILLGAAVICVLFSMLGIKARNFGSRLDGKEGAYLCTVVDEPQYTSGYTVFTVEAVEDGNDAKTTDGKLKFILWVDMRQDAASADVGDIISARLRFTKPGDEFKRSYFQDGIYVSTYCYSAEVVGERFVIIKPVILLRRFIRKALGTYFDGDTKALMNGLILGDDSEMSAELYSAFKACGMSHITAVSGLHIGIICSLFVTLFGSFTTKRNAEMLAIIPLAAVVAVTGFTPSAVRAGIMCLVTFGGDLVFKKSDSLNSLGVAAGTMMLFNPYIISSISFQLSCVATAGVIIFSPFGALLTERLNKRIKYKVPSRILGGIIQSFCLSVGAAVFTLPLQLLHFGYISVTAPICSVLVCAAVTYALSFAIVGLIIYAVPVVGAAAVVPFAAAGVFADYIAAVAKTVAKLPFSYIPIGDKAMILWLALVMALLAVWLLLGRVGGKRTVSLLAAALLTMTLAANGIASRSKISVAVLDLGKTYCTVVSHGKTCVVFGCGDDTEDYYTIKNHIKLNALYNIDSVVLSSEAQVKNGCAERIISEYAPKNVYVTDGVDAELGVEVKVLNSGETKKLPINITVTPHRCDDGFVFEIAAFDKTVMLASSAGFNGVDTADCEVVVADNEMPLGKQNGITVIKGGQPRLKAGGFEGRTVFAPRSDVNVTIRKGKEVAVSAE